MRKCFKLAFDCTNNEAEYEAMMLEIHILKDFQVRRVVIDGDSDFVIKKIQGEYQAKHAGMRSYINPSLDLIGFFEGCKLNQIPRLQNGIANSLATSTTIFKIPMYPNNKYEIEFKHRPFVPDNVKNLMFFEDDKQIHNFVNLTGEFDGLVIDEDNMLLEGSTLTPGVPTKSN